MSIEDKLPEGTVVIDDISKLSEDSRRIFEHFGWDKEKDPLGKYQGLYHQAYVLSHEPKGIGSDRVKEPELVLKDRSKGEKPTILPNILPQLFGAFAIRYLESLHKKKDVSIKGATAEEWGFFPRPRDGIDIGMFKQRARTYMSLALDTPEQPHYSQK